MDAFIDRLKNDAGEIGNLWMDWRTNEKDILDKLSRHFETDRAQRYIFVVCLQRPEICDKTRILLQNACEKSGKTKQFCESIVDAVMAEFCRTEKDSVACDGYSEKKSTSAGDGVTEAEATTKAKMNMLLIGGAAAVIFFIIVAIGLFFFCKSSTPPPPPPPAATVTKSGTGKRKHKKKKNKKKRKATTTSGGSSKMGKTKGASTTKTPEEVV